MKLDDVARIRWQCRRGMLELDWILTGFLQQVYLKLDDPMKRCFLRLLECPDQDLLAYLTGRELPSDADLVGIVTLIREHIGDKASSA